MILTRNRLFSLIFLPYNWGLGAHADLRKYFRSVEFVLGPLALQIYPLRNQGKLKLPKKIKADPSAYKIVDQEDGEVHIIMEHNCSTSPQFLCSTSAFQHMHPSKKRRLYMIRKPKPGFWTWLLRRKPTKTKVEVR